MEPITTLPVPGPQPVEPGHQRRGVGKNRGTGFDNLLAEQRFSISNHAAERLARRGLQVSSDQAERLATAIDRAAAKGAKTSLILLDELALLVRVPERTVVTAMEPSRMREGVVTRIDSAVVI